MIKRYLSLPRSIGYLAGAQFLSNLVNAAMLLVFNLHLRALGYSDPAIADLTSYRFLAILLLALPVGVCLRGRRTKPFFIAATLVLLTSSWVAVEAAERGADLVMTLALATWGVGMMTLQVAALPFIIRHADKEHRTEALSLSFSTWSLSLIAGGLLIRLLSSIGSVDAAGLTLTFDARGVLETCIALSTLALPLVTLIRERPASEAPATLRNMLSYDWRRITDAMAPAVLIAVGAGMTIPFMNLFFNSVFDFGFESFAVLGAATGTLVWFGAMLNPYIHRRFGYRISVLLVQAIAVGFLLMLAATQFYAPSPIALAVAITCYVLRQPLMNMAGPITSELAMSYVGERNRELVSALGATIWSGSWFISSRLFRQLRQAGYDYWQVFVVTATLYVFGILMYWRLIRLDEHRPSLSNEDRVERELEA